MIRGTVCPLVDAIAALNARTFCTVVGDGRFIFGGIAGVHTLIFGLGVLLCESATATPCIAKIHVITATIALFLPFFDEENAIALVGKGRGKAIARFLAPTDIVLIAMLIADVEKIHSNSGAVLSFAIVPTLADV